MMINENSEVANPSVGDAVGLPPVTMVMSSQSLGWSGIVVEQLSYACTQIELTPQSDHILTLHIAEPTSLVQKRDGRSPKRGISNRGVYPESSRQSECVVLGQISRQTPYAACA